MSLMSVKLFSRVALVAAALCGCDAAPPVGPPLAPAVVEAPGRPMPDVGAAPVQAEPSESAPAAPLTVLSARVQPLPPGAPATAAFCIGCGGALKPKCGKCSAQLPAGAKFCLDCGTPVTKA